MEDVGRVRTGDPKRGEGAGAREEESREIPRLQRCKLVSVNWSKKGGRNSSKGCL